MSKASWEIRCRLAALHQHRVSGMKSCILFDPDARHKGKSVVQHSSQCIITRGEWCGSENRVQCVVLPFEFVIDRSPACRDDNHLAQLRCMTKLKFNYGRLACRSFYSRPWKRYGPLCDKEQRRRPYPSPGESSDPPILRPRYTAFQPAPSKTRTDSAFDLFWTIETRKRGGPYDNFSRVWHSGSHVQTDPHLLLLQVLLRSRYFHSITRHPTYCGYERRSEDDLPAHVEILQRKKRLRET